MSDRLKSLREKRGIAVKSMRDMIDVAQKEKRDLTAEELVTHDKLFDETENLRKQIDAEERTVELERESADKSAAGEEEKRSIAGKGGAGGGETAKLQMTAFRNYLRTGKVSGEGADELRAYQAGSDTEGGYLVAPREFVASLLKGVDNQVFIRDRATKYQVTQADGLGVPTLETDAADADWTVELATGSEETTMRFGNRDLRPHPLAKRIKVSKRLLRVSVLPIDQIIMDRFGYKFGVTQEKAYLTGDGAQKPLGVFTASNDGIPTSRDVSTGNTTTAMTFDGLMEAKYSVKGQYWSKADWLFHRDGVKQIVKLKDGDGQYLWRMSVRDGEPDTLLGRPLMVSEYAPNTFTTGLYVGLFGDFSYYWIVDALGMQVQRLTELYAETNQDGFIARYEGDGMPVLSEAFARVKLA